MADLALDPGVASEFVKYLNAQLKETREQLQRSTEENAALRELLAASQPTTGLTSGRSAEANETERLRSEVKRLRAELDDARNSTRAYQAEIATSRTQCQQLEPQLPEAAAHTGQVLVKMRQELAAAASHGPAGGQTLTQFRALLQSLPSMSAYANSRASRVAFHGTKLPVLSKATLKACVGGVCFFGNLLEWSAAPSQHAYAIFPEYWYNLKPADNEPTWTAAVDCDSLVGEQRELFYINNGNISYAGTFLCHAGPRSLKVADLSVDIETVAQDVAVKTFHVHIKSPQSRQAKANTYVPLLADLYTEGAATVRVLGLQRVGFNKKLFEMLRKAYGQRKQKLSESASTSTMSTTHVDPGATPAPASKAKGKGKKRALDWFEIWDEGDDGSRPGPSKVPRLDEGEVDDPMAVWRA